MSRSGASTASLKTPNNGALRSLRWKRPVFCAFAAAMVTAAMPAKGSMSRSKRSGMY